MSESTDVRRHLSPDRPLHDALRDIWMRDNRRRFGTDGEAEAAWRSHWAKVDAFLGWIEGLDTVILVPGDDGP